MSQPFLRVAQSSENRVTIPVRKTGGGKLSPVSVTSFRHTSSAVLRFVLILLNVVTFAIECEAVACNTPSVKHITRDIVRFLCLHYAVRNAHCVLHRLPIGSCIVLVVLCEN